MRAPDFHDAALYTQKLNHVRWTQINVNAPHLNKLTLARIDLKMALSSENAPRPH